MNKICPKPVKCSRYNKLTKRLFDYNKYQKHLMLNGFNIIELNEEVSNILSFKDLNIFSEEELFKMKKKANSIENYYANKSDDSIINVNCFICLLNGFTSNELLYFNRKKDLLIYLNYCFYFLKNILFLDNNIYLKNRYDLEKSNLNYLIGWKFYIPKTVCRSCFLKIINMEDLFSNLKNIFIDIVPKPISKKIDKKTRFKNRIRIRNPLITSDLDKYIKDKIRTNKNKLHKQFRINISKKQINKISNEDSNNYSNNNNSISSYHIKNDLLYFKNDILRNNDNFNNCKNDDKFKINIKNQNSILYENIINHSDELKVIEIEIENDF